MSAEAIKLVRPACDKALRDCMTEDELALSFVDLLGKDYRYVPGWGWMHAEPTRWVRDVKLEHYNEARGLCRLIGSHSPDEKRLGKAQTVAAVVQLAHADQRIVELPAAFDADRQALNTPAGIVNLREATIRPYAREYLTKCTSVAPAFGETPTTWLRFLKDVFKGDEDVIAFVRRLLGYALTGETREQVVAFLHGDGANGKSTLLDVLLGIMGNYALKVPSSMLMAQRGERHPTEIAQLCGIRLAVANEIAEGEHWDESRVKELTGDMKLTGRFMRQDFFQFDATHKFLVAANHRPQLRAMDYAMRRRLLLVPFSARFEGDRRDPDMLAKLQAEAPAILAWLVIGAADWFECGLQTPSVIEAATSAYADAMDSLGLWLRECCRVTRDALDSEKSSVLYRSYFDWKQARGEQPISQTRWGEQMRVRQFDSYLSNGVRYRSIQLTSDERQRMDDVAANRK